MDDQKDMIFLRREVPQLHKNLLNEMIKSFAQGYQNIKYDPVEFPTRQMEENLAEMSAILEKENTGNSFINNTSQSDAIAERISSVKKAFFSQKKD